MMNSAMGGGHAPATFSAPAGPLSSPAPAGPLSGSMHLSPGQFGGTGPIQGKGGFPVIPPSMPGAPMPLHNTLMPMMKPPINLGPHLPPSGSYGEPPLGSGPTIL